KCHHYHNLPYQSSFLIKWIFRFRFSRQARFGLVFSLLIVHLAVTEFLQNFSIYFVLASLSFCSPLSSLIVPYFCNKSQRSEEHTSELQSRFDLVCRLLLEKKNTKHSQLILLYIPHY